MGNCTYVIKARFPRGKLDKVYESIMAFWRQGLAADAWYDERRDCCDKWKTIEQLTKEQKVEFTMVKDAFWTEFKEKFPLIAEMLKGIKDHGYVLGVWHDAEYPILLMTKDPSNSLFGFLDFGGHGKNPNEVVMNFRREGNVLIFTDEVWNVADWNPLAKYLKKKFGATAVKWLSEESAHSFSEQVKV